MAYTVADLKVDLVSILHGTSLSKIPGINNLIYRGGRKLMEDVDPMEMIRIVEIPNALYDKVYDYTAPADLKGDRIIDIRPQVKRSLRDRFFQYYNEEFDLAKSYIDFGGLFTVQYNSGVKSVRIAKNLIAGILVNGADSITNNGTWAVGGNATNLTVDTLNYLYGDGSLRFDVSAGANPSTAYLECTGMQQVNIERDLNQGAEFVWVWIPDPTTVTNWKLRWGNDSSNYWENTVVAAQDDTAFQTGWNLLRFDWTDATMVGTPDSETIDYLRITVTYNGTADTDYRVNQFMSQLGTIYQMEYYSKYIFRNASTGAFQETITSTSDSEIINLDVDSYNLLLNIVAYYCAQIIQGSNANFDATYFLNEYNTSKNRYVAKIKSQVIKPSQTYYKMPRKRTWYKRWP